MEPPPLKNGTFCCQGRSSCSARRPCLLVSRRLLSSEYKISHHGCLPDETYSAPPTYLSLPSAVDASTHITCCRSVYHIVRTSPSTRASLSSLHLRLLLTVFIMCRLTSSSFRPFYASCPRKTTTKHDYSFTLILLMLHANSAMLSEVLAPSNRKL